MKTASLPEISDIQFLEVLGQGSSSIVYKASRRGQTVAVKFFHNDARRPAGPDEALRFRKEAAILAKLNHPAFARVFEINEHQGRPYVITEYVEGKTLAEKLSQGPLQRRELIDFAVEIAESLIELHKRRLIHRDLKPENILVGGTGRIHLIDFGLVTETQAKLENQDEAIVGTPLYAAPEQTGLLKRPVDERADIYSLGCVLYHCATGRPPFEAASAADLLRKHLSEIPLDPSQINTRVSSVLSAIILKLLAKDPDDRYRSARSFLLDLKNIDAIESSGPPYSLGSRDRDISYSELPLFGRDEEIKALIQALDRAHSGSGSAILVEGESGSGKTRLIRELIEFQSRKGGLSLSGKAQLGEKLPFGPLREIMDELVARALRSEKKDRERIIAAVSEAAAEFAPIIRRLSPGLRNLLGESRELPPLDGNAEQERFYESISDFLVRLSAQLGTLVLLIDDVQWIDDGSVEIIKRLSGKLEKANLLVAFTSRNEPKHRLELHSFTESCKDLQLQRVSLSPLPFTAVSQLIAALLGGRQLDPLYVEKIATMSSGNAFAIGEYVRALFDAGVLFATEQMWRVDARRFDSVHLPDDVLELVLSRVAILDERSVRVLATAAVVGFDFDPNFLLLLDESSRDRVNRALSEGLENNLVEKREARFSFVHDRVREALIKTIPETELPTLHESIAETLEKTSDGTPEFVYSIARHFSLAPKTKNAEKIFSYCKKGGQYAVEAFSNDEARALLETALGAGTDLGKAKADLCPVYELLGLACTRTGQHELAIQHFSVALDGYEQKKDKARILYLIGLAQGSAGEHEQAKRSLVNALEMLDASYPKTKVGQAASLLYHLVAAHLRIRSRIGFGKAKGEERERRIMLSRINSAMNLLAYFLGDSFLMAQSIVRELHNVQFLGVSVETSKAHVFYAVFMSFLALKGAVRKHGTLALEMVKQLGVQEAIAYCEYYYAVAVEISGDTLEGQRMILDCYERVIRYCSAWEKAGIIDHRTHLIVQGKARELIEWLERTEAEILRTGDQNNIQVFRFVASPAFHMLGRHKEATRFAQTEGPDAQKELSVRFVRSFRDSNFIHACYISRNFGPELEKAIESFYDNGLQTFHTRYGYSLVALVRLEQMRSAKTENQKKNFEAMLKYSLKLARFPMSVTAVHRCLYHAARAGYAVERGKLRQARRILNRAEKEAIETENHWAHWLVWRERARLAQQSGNQQLRNVAIRGALALCETQRWMSFDKQIRTEFRVESRTVAENSADGLGRIATIERYVEALLQVSLASVSTLDPETQAQTILDAMVRVLSAERAFLFESDPKDKQLRFRAGRDSLQKNLAELRGYSSTVVQRAHDERRCIVVSGTEEGEVLGSQSAVLHNLRSIIAAPLQFRDKLLGVIYLDSTLASGIFSEKDIGIVSAMANHIAIGIETARTAKMEAEQQALRKDLELAGAVQALFLPQLPDCSGPRFSLAGFYQSAAQAGGDWWWYDHTQEGKLLLLQGDVTGHGAASALVTAIVASTARHVLRSAGKDPVPILLKEIQTSLWDMCQGQYLMTVTALEFNLDESSVSYWTAGAPPFLIERKQDGKVAFIHGKESLPLGMDEYCPASGKMEFQTGDRLFMFTDCAFEMTSSSSERSLGLRRLRDLYLDSAKESQSVEMMRDALWGRFKKFMGDRELQDDLTFVLVENRGR